MLLTTATAWADTGDEADGVYYIGADGKLKNTATDGIPGNDTPTALDENFVFPMTAGWYVVTGDFEFPALINTTGEVHLILADGKTMTITTGYGSAIDLGGDLTIYGQSLGTGKLIANGSQCGITSNTNAENLTINGGNVTATGGNDYGISFNNVTINGGNVTATGGYYGIYALNNVTISGGIVTATGGNGIGIYAQGGNITLGGGIVNASSYSGTVNLTCDYRNADGTTIISGSYSDSYLINGKTLQPAYDIRLQDNADNDAAITADYHDGVPQFVTLQGRTLWKDGAWNTLCLPFALTAEQIAANADFAGAEIRELSSASFDDGTLTLDFTPATGEGAVTGITAGVPCIIRWESGSSFTPTFSGVTIDATARNKACDLGGGKSITFTGTYNPVRYADENKSVLFLGEGNTLYYPDGTATTTIGACRAYFALSGIEAGDPSDPSAPGVRAFTLNFGEGEETGIQEITDPTPDPSPSCVPLVASVPKGPSGREGSGYRRRDTAQGHKPHGTPLPCRHNCEEGAIGERSDGGAKPVLGVGSEIISSQGGKEFLP